MLVGAKAEENEVCILDVGNALLVANTGQPLTRAGVVSVCASHLSAKSTNIALEHYSEVADEELVEAIRDRELQVFRIDPNRITSDFRSAEETRRDYGGRALWELLQNADDAMDADRAIVGFIGAKGLGFKSVLEISDTPEIHSGLFGFQSPFLKRTYDPPSTTYTASELPPTRIRHPFFQRRPEPTSPGLAVHLSELGGVRYLGRGVRVRRPTSETGSDVGTQSYAVVIGGLEEAAEST